MNSYQNYLVFKTDKLFLDKASFKGVNGTDVVIQPDFDPQKHVVNFGEVVSIPLHLTHRPITQEHRGSPAYHEESPFVYRFLHDIEQEVQVGMKIYYHFNTICNKNLVRVDGKHPNRVFYYKVSYDQVICAVRNGVIIPIASFILADPDFESWDDILVKTYSHLKDEQGNPIELPKDKWIQRKVKPEYKFLTAYVRHTGKPFKGDTCEIAVGDKIYYRRNADWINKIEDREYFVIRQRHITGKEVDGKFIPIRGHMLVIPEPEPDQTSTGIIIKQRLTRKGTVFAQGDSNYPEGMQIMFGESDRQEIVLKGEKYLLIKKGDVFATHERTVKP